MWAPDDLHAQRRFCVKRRTDLLAFDEYIGNLAMAGERFACSLIGVSVFINSPMSVQRNRHGYDILFPHLLDRSMLHVKNDIFQLPRPVRQAALKEILPRFACILIPTNHFTQNSFIARIYALILHFALPSVRNSGRRLLGGLRLASSRLETRE